MRVRAREHARERERERGREEERERERGREGEREHAGTQYARAASVCVCAPVRGAQHAPPLIRRDAVRVVDEHHLCVCVCVCVCVRARARE